MDLPINIAPLWSSWGGITAAFKSFWNQVSSWDFSLFKYIILGLIAFFVVYIIFMFINWKIRVTNLMFWLNYWVKFIVWDYWSWKTKNLFQYWYLWKQQNPDWILIANIPYNFVDYHFDSKEDFDCIMKDLVQYIRDTNSVEFLKQWKEFPPILLLWDEIHEYLFNRDFKTLSKDVVLVLTQCRKRNIEINCVSQRVSQVDVFLKRLVWIFHQYVLLFKKLGIRKEYIKDCVNPDSNDINDENSYEILEECILLPDSVALWFHKDLNEYYSQKYLTYYVVWGVNTYANETDVLLLKKWDLIYSHNYLNFKADIMKKLEILNTPLPPKENKIKLLYKWLFKSENINQQLIEEQSKLIEKMKKMISPEDWDQLSNDPDFKSEFPKSNSVILPDNYQWSVSETFKELSGHLNDNI